MSDPNKVTMSDPNRIVHVVEFASVNAPLTQFMELACARMALEMKDDISKWEGLRQLEELVETQAKEIKALKRSHEKLENTIDTLCKVMGVGRQRFPHTPDNNTSTADEED